MASPLSTKWMTRPAIPTTLTVASPSAREVLLKCNKPWQRHSPQKEPWHDSGAPVVLPQRWPVLFSGTTLLVWVVLLPDTPPIITEDDCSPCLTVSTQSMHRHLVHQNNLFSTPLVPFWFPPYTNLFRHCRRSFSAPSPFHSSTRRFQNVSLFHRSFLSAQTENLSAVRRSEQWSPLAARTRDTEFLGRFLLSCVRPLVASVLIVKPYLSDCLKAEATRQSLSLSLSLSISLSLSEEEKKKLLIHARAVRVTLR